MNVTNMLISLRYEKVRTEEPTEEAGVKESFRSRLKWAGYVERREGEGLMKRVYALRVESRRKED